MKKYGFIIEVEFYSTSLVHYFSFNRYSIFCSDACVYPSKRMAQYAVINLLRNDLDIKMFNIKRIKR